MALTRWVSSGGDQFLQDQIDPPDDRTDSQNEPAQCSEVTPLENCLNGITVGLIKSPGFSNLHIVGRQVVELGVTKRACSVPFPDGVLGIE